MKALALLITVLLIAACSSLPGSVAEECRPINESAEQGARCAGTAVLDGLQFLDLIVLVGSVIP